MPNYFEGDLSLVIPKNYWQLKFIFWLTLFRRIMRNWGSPDWKQYMWSEMTNKKNMILLFSKKIYLIFLFFHSLQGSTDTFRGYPCTLWTLFHTLTVHAADKGNSFDRITIAKSLYLFNLGPDLMNSEK